MTEFEQQLKKALKGDVKMAMEPEVRGKIDAAYGKIRKQQKRRRFWEDWESWRQSYWWPGGYFLRPHPGHRLWRLSR
ncbi:hypothetical protein [Enterococcus diestrammenae]|uniref:hypothetical protein n=1 Tax=Enterococcus diestrammenae TaxID=1155073 RepID=UPI0022E24A0B|nr:hypothetical protein [Enterococcus diestrammenae]